MQVADADHAQGPALSTPVVLVVLDGWGIGRHEPGNAVIAAATPTMDRLLKTYPHATLLTSGESVGLPAGQMGNSEVGHLNLGAGFVVYQWITRIDRAITEGSFATNPTLLGAIAHVERTGGTLHLLGLLSDGGVHSHVRHLDALLDLAASRRLHRVAIHAFTDGRDTAPDSGLSHVEALERRLDRGTGAIATVSGRYYAMDRDHRWERTELAYHAIARGLGPRASSASSAVRASYGAGVTDEFLLPTVIERNGKPVATIEAGDAVINFNFRSDRGRQLVEALSVPAFRAFPRPPLSTDLLIATLTRYDASLPAHVAFEPQDVVHPIARAISQAGLAQFHAAETEKYPHVTFFFNGGREDPFPGEERALIPSPWVATYDLQPEMSAAGVTDAVVAALASRRFAFTLVNFANGDMVGHTGVFSAAVRAIETVDDCLARVLDATLKAGGVALVTADHGNAEEMLDRITGRPMTAHTTNPVPIILVAPDDHPARNAVLRQNAVLAAVAPTLLDLLGVLVPADMTEAPLILPRATA